MVFVAQFARARFGLFAAQPFAHELGRCIVGGKGGWFPLNFAMLVQMN
jgi:hypothetical protein